MINKINITLHKFSLKTYLLSIAIILPLLFGSCGLFDKEIKQDKRIADFRYRMNKVIDSLDNHKERIKAFELIIADIQNDEDLITPRKKNILLIEGNTFISNEFLILKNYKKAIEYSNIIISIDSTSPKGFYSRGCIYQIEDKDSLAILDYTKAIKLNSDYTDAYYNRGIIYEELGELDKALSDYNKAVKLNPSYITDVYTNRGNTYLEKKDYDKAIADYNKVLDIDSSNVKAYSNRAGIYILKEEYDKALADCNKAISLDSINVNAYSKRASVYVATKEYKEALEDYKKILEIAPDDDYETHEAIRKAMKNIRLHTPK